MIIELIIIPISILVAFYSGFYFGYLKREGKAPEMPGAKTFKMVKKVVTQKPEEIDHSYDW